MATEQIQTSQISGYAAGGGAKATKIITLAGGSADKATAAFSFVVGPCMIEILTGSSDNGNDVLNLLWVNLRSYSGTKTADITDRLARGVAMDQGQSWCLVDRTTSGTVVNIGQIKTGTYGVNPDGTTTIASLTNWNWPNPGRIRVTAWEDTES